MLKTNLPVVNFTLAEREVKRNLKTPKLYCGGRQYMDLTPAALYLIG
jgi:hypothetical protein